MSYLTETATLEFDPNGGSTSNNNAGYDYHLPHTKTIDLIGEEFVQKSRPVGGQSVVVENLHPNGGGLSSTSHVGPNVVLVNSSNSGSGVPLQVQQILQQAQTQVRFQYIKFEYFLQVLIF